MSERTIEISFRKLNGGEFLVDSYDPSTGESTNLGLFMYSPDEHPEFNESVGNELYFWLSALMED